MGDRVFETYDGLWGNLMLLMHDQDYLWEVNEGRADWFESLEVGSDLRILDLGCGNGVLDIVLARRGHRVVGVDQVRPVIHRARQLVDGESIAFIVSDLRDLMLDDEQFDVVFMFGLAGLMSTDDDTAVIQRVRDWISPDGSLLVDGDLELAEAQTIESDHPDGTIYWHWASDPASRTNKLSPELHRRDGVVVELRDPIDPSRGNHTGLQRYIYPPEELTQLLKDADYEVNRVGHFFEYVFPDQPPDRYMLHARPVAG